MRRSRGSSNGTFVAGLERQGQRDDVSSQSRPTYRVWYLAHPWPLYRTDQRPRRLWRHRDQLRSYINTTVRTRLRANMGGDSRCHVHLDHVDVFRQLFSVIKGIHQLHCAVLEGHALSRFLGQLVRSKGTHAVISSVQIRSSPFALTSAKTIRTTDIKLDARYGSTSATSESRLLASLREERRSCDAVCTKYACDQLQRSSSQDASDEK